MKRVLCLLALATTSATATAVTSPVTAGAAGTVSPVVALVHTIDLPSYPEQKGDALIYVVHGLNLDGQHAQNDGGTAVTVCAEGSEPIGDLEFGDIVGPITVEDGVVIDLEVFLGAGVPCDTATPAVIAEEFTPTGEHATSLVASAGSDAEPELLPIPLETSGPAECELTTDRRPAGPAPSTGRLGLAHASGLPLATVLLDDGDPTDLVFSQSVTWYLVPDLYTLAVEVDGEAVVGPLDVDIDPCTLVQHYMVGAQPLPEPTTTTTTSPATTTTAAAAAAVTPRFTG